MKTIIYIMIISNMLINTCYAQNLIQNSSFEDYNKGKKHNIPFSDLDHWNIPNKCSPDVFCKYNTYSNMFAFNKTLGKDVIAYSGETFIGIDSYDVYLRREYREYIKTKFTQELAKGHRYCFSMYIRLGASCRYATNGIDVLATPGNIKIREENLLYQNIVPTISELGGVISEKNDWLHICRTFKAKGGEKYIIIGNFKTDKNTTVKKLEQKKFNRYDTDDSYDASYYLIDDVSLVEIENESECNCNKEDTLLMTNEQSSEPVFDKISTASVGESFKIPNLYFEIDKSEIKPASYSTLDSLFQQLSIHKNIKISIIGHTDNSGDEQKNLELSINRAKSVAMYLIKKGIFADRILYDGKGSSIPVSTNDTENGREMNRRVEIIIR